MTEEQTIITSSIKYVLDKDDAADGVTTMTERRMSCARRVALAISILIISHVKTSSLLLDNYKNNKELAVPRRLTFSAPLGEVIPPPFIYTKELHSTNKDMLRSLGNNDTKIDMVPEVYVNLTNRIRRLKHEGKPLKIMVNSHPCSGKSHFIWNGDGVPGSRSYKGIKLVDLDWLNPSIRDSSYLMQNTTVNNTILLGDSLRSQKGMMYEDIIYIYVIPRYNIIERNTEQRVKKDGGSGKWSNFGNVMERRRLSLLQTVNDGELVQPLFSSFEEGLDFVIYLYNIDSRIDDPNRTNYVVKIRQPN